MQEEDWWLREAYTTILRQRWTEIQSVLPSLFESHDQLLNLQVAASALWVFLSHFYLQSNLRKYEAYKSLGFMGNTVYAIHAFSFRTNLQLAEHVFEVIALVLLCGKVNFYSSDSSNPSVSNFQRRSYCSAERKRTPREVDFSSTAQMDLAASINIIESFKENDIFDHQAQSLVSNSCRFIYFRFSRNFIPILLWKET